MSRACPASMELPALIDYWFGELPDDATERVEEHLLECDACGDRLQALVGLRDGVRRVARSGAVELFVTDAFLRAAVASGLRTREYRVAPGGRVACTVTAEDDLLVGRLQADFGGVTSCDVLLHVAGQSVHRIEDVPVSAADHELIWSLAMPAARALGEQVLEVRLVAREGEGVRVLGDYTFAHTPARA